ncbi:MAG: hypothetical protein AAF609_27530 [Cyanobacteria bacterium P01_C01_bin.120]
MNRVIFRAIAGTAGLSLWLGVAQLPFWSGKAVQLSVAQAKVKLQAMTLERLGAVLAEESDDLQGQSGMWQLTLAGQPVIVLADATNNRMRIVSPIVPAETLSVDQVEAILVANFHSALDARYAVTDGTVVALYVHPLNSLQEGDLRSALRQVTALAATYGTTYSSSELGFGPAAAPVDEAKSLEDIFGI